jgi:predicted transcriptional regulator
VNCLEWRRSKVLELSSQGHSQPEIARILQISQPTVNRDSGYLRGQAKQNLQKHIQDKLPEEYQNCMTGINQVLKICWDIVNKSRNVNNNDNDGNTVTITDNKTVLQALALINDCNKYKMDLTTNGVVITDAIKFIQGQMDHLNNQEKKLLQDIKEDEAEAEQKDIEQEKTTNEIF